MKTVDLRERLIGSPSHPSYYSDNTDCTWTLTNLLSDTSKIKIHFYSFKTKDAGDKVIITDLFDNTVSQFSGSSIPSDTISKGKKIKIRFESDGSGREKGFVLKYDMTGIIYSIITNYNDTSIYCYTIIMIH